ncbi:hypothetical protein NL676_009206 [Syzygium grande]|nr:hypothetical protein NL676_009206 [Syzygium grande]
MSHQMRRSIDEGTGRVRRRKGGRRVIDIQMTLTLTYQMTRVLVGMESDLGRVAEETIIQKMSLTKIDLEGEDMVFSAEIITADAEDGD